MSPLSTSASLLLLPGRALLRQGGRMLEERRGEGWDGALSSLEALVPQAGGMRRVAVGLSHHFASVHVFAAPPMRLGKDEMQGWLRERLVQDFGAEAEAWRLAWQDTPPGRPVPVATMPAERWEALTSRLAGIGAVLARATPWFGAAWARHREALGRAGGWLALVEPCRLALARVEGGMPVHVGVSRLDAQGVPAQVAAAVTRQALHLGVPAAGKVGVLAPETPWDGPVADQALKFQVLGGSGAGWGGLLP